MASQPKLAPKEEVVYSLAVCFEKSMIYSKTGTLEIVVV